MLGLGICVIFLGFTTIGLGLTNMLFFRIIDGMRDDIHELQKEIKKNGL